MKKQNAAEAVRVDVSIARGSQDVFFTELLSFREEKLRIKIRSNSYKDQCSAELEIWSAAGRQWNEVVRLHAAEMQTEKGLCYGPQMVLPADFAKDRAVLLNRAMLVLA